MKDERLFIFKLKQLKGIGNIGLLKILQYYLDHDKKDMTAELMMIVGNVKKQYQQRFVDSFYISSRITPDDFYYFQEQISFLTILDDDYPLCLSEIYNPPIALFYLGNSQSLSGNNLAIIGSREASENGREMIESLVPQLVKKDVIIVSGLAKGNDTFAHQSAIRNGGQTIGVIGSGLNVTYPKENKRLQEYMAKNQLIISEYSLGTPPHSFHFPSRNRIIAGISRGICVVEAKKKSGTFITAQIGLEEGRDVFAVPSNPLKEDSNGCLQLIQDGAKCIWQASDILEEWL